MLRKKQQHHCWKKFSPIYEQGCQILAALILSNIGEEKHPSFLLAIFLAPPLNNLALVTDGESAVDDRLPHDLSV